MGDTDVAVIGGGIAGASVAYHLAGTTDHRVTVYERGDLASETTAKSAAFFGFYGTPVERRLKRYGMATYNAFFDDPRMDLRYRLAGRIDVATTDAGAETLRGSSTPDESDDGSDPTVLLDGDEVHGRLLLPELEAGNVVAARYRPGVGYLRPRAIGLEFVDRAGDRGATFETGADVTAIETHDGQAAALVADGELIEAGSVVLAAGPWNRGLAGTAGLDLPATNSLAPVLRVERPEPANHPLPIVMHVESGVYVRGDEAGTLLIGHHPTDDEGKRIMDPDAAPVTVPDRLREAMRDALGTILPSLVGAPILDEWVGVRSHTPDGHPILGATDVAGLSVVAFDTSGIQLAPAAGRIVAEELLGGEPPVDADALSIGRFDGHSARRSALGRDP